MGPTCPGGSLARLPGSGCWRTQDETTVLMPADVAEILRIVDGVNQRRVAESRNDKSRRHPEG
jgi:hypothetical protein